MRTISIGTITILFMLVLLGLAAGCTTGTGPVTTSQATTTGSFVNLTGTGGNYPAYVAAPVAAGTYPGIVLLHSFNGLEHGYLTISDRFAAAGYVVVAPEWQTYDKTPADGDVGALVSSGLGYLRARPDVRGDRLGLTGFCAGGRYTMLFLPRMKDFRAGVAWYGFPYNRGFANETRPVDLIGTLDAPILIIHGSADQASPVTDIYQYALALNQSDKYFELKEYMGEPHGFMIKNGEINDSDVGMDAFREMVTFFNRTLKGPGISR